MIGEYPNPIDKFYSFGYLSEFLYLKIRRNYIVAFYILLRLIKYLKIELKKISYLLNYNVDDKSYIYSINFIDFQALFR